MVSFYRGHRDLSLLHSPVGAGALLVARQLINTSRLCQEEGRETAAVGRK